MINRIMKHTTKNIIVILTLTGIYLSATSFPSYAELLPVTAERSLFLKMDANRDGLISQKEVYKKSLLAIEFENFDKNQDGFLDRDEFWVFIISANI